MKKFFYFFKELILFIFYFMIIKSGVLIIYSARLFVICIHNKDLYDTLKAFDSPIISLLTFLSFLLTLNLLRYKWQITYTIIKKYFKKLLP